MKALSKELLDRAIAATVAAIEIYNKPDYGGRFGDIGGGVALQPSGFGIGKTATSLLRISKRRWC